MPLFDRKDARFSSNNLFSTSSIRLNKAQNNNLSSNLSLLVPLPNQPPLIRIPQLKIFPVDRVCCVLNWCLPIFTFNPFFAHIRLNPKCYHQCGKGYIRKLITRSFRSHTHGLDSTVAPTGHPHLDQSLFWNHMFNITRRMVFPAWTMPYDGNADHAFLIYSGLRSVYLATSLAVRQTINIK